MLKDKNESCWIKHITVTQKNPPSHFWNCSKTDVFLRNKNSFKEQYTEILS